MVRLLHDILEQAAIKFADKEALFFKGSSMTYGQIAEQSDKLRACLSRQDLQKGDRVAFFMEKRFEKVVSIFGISAAGGVMTPIKRLSQPHQAAYILQNSGATVLITTESRFQQLIDFRQDLPNLNTVILLDRQHANGRYDDLRVNIIDWRDMLATATDDVPAAPINTEHDLAAILYTSGSTGKPKGVVLDHLNIVSGAKSVAEYLKIDENDRLLSILSFGFDYGLNQLTSSFLHGAQLYLLNHLFNKDIVAAVEKYRITGLAAVAATWNQLLQSKWDYPQMSSLRYISNSGGAIPENNVLELARRLPETDIYLMYGLTEAFRSTFLDPRLVAEKPTSMGKAIPGNEVIIVDAQDRLVKPGHVGELVHRGPLVAQGYWGDPELTAVRFRSDPMQPKEVPLGRYVVYSGDYVRIDAEGYLYFVGRKDEMIKCGGNRISPTEVEEILYSSGRLQDAIVLGIPDEIYGHAVMAVVVPGPEASITADELKKHCRRLLPPYMVPKVIEIRESLPRNASGKLDRSLVKNEILSSFDNAGVS